MMIQSEILIKWEEGDGCNFNKGSVEELEITAHYSTLQYTTVHNSTLELTLLWQFPIVNECSLAELLLLALSLAELLLAQPLDELLLVFSAAELLLLVLPLSEA